ncbi:hypothetical protein BSPWISOXPB_5470 [uncultured Gammaproteobacteria bacterium]|nr:hypothetical protein BSPWISOXPB_5470 [uncultured Gammaproteobacteria bacterium]
MVRKMGGFGLFGVVFKGRLTTITECDEKKSEDCTKNTKSSLCRAWKHSERDCKYFVNFILDWQRIALG